MHAALKNFVAGILAVSSILTTQHALGEVGGVAPYWVDSLGVPIRSGSNSCWRSSAWAPEHSIPSCDPKSFPDDHVLPPHAGIGGQSLNDWITRFWEWRLTDLAGQPDGTDPMESRCDQGQEGPVWFLAGRINPGRSIRDCVVPPGKHLLIALLAKASLRAAMLYPNCDQSREDVGKEIDRVSSLKASLNGARIRNLELHREKSFQCYRISVHKDGFPAARFEAAMDGYWLAFRPLPPGHYTLEISSDSLGDGARNVFFSLSIQ